MEADSRQTSIRQALDLTAHCIVLTAFLSVVRSISPLSASIFVPAYAAASYISAKKVFDINRTVLNMFALLFGFLIISQASLENLGGPIIDLLLLFLVIKALEQKMFRDYMQIYALSVLLLAASSLLALDMIFAAYFIVMLFFISLGAVLLSYFSHDEDMLIRRSVLRKIITRSLIIPAIALPLTAVMFIILPRTAFPVWSMFTKQGAAYSGFSDKVDLGSVSSIQESSAVILRVKTGRVAQQQLYWRGIVLDKFNGKSWSASSAIKQPGASQVSTKMPRAMQTVFLEPYGNRYLFALDKPAGYSLKNARQSNGLVATLPEIPQSRIRYEAVSYLSDYLPDQEPDREIYLSLPESGLERTIQLARKLTNSLSAHDAALRIISHFNSAEYAYSLSSLPVSDNPVEEFLFSKKKGNCEYFASSMAVMLRIAGIPSRLVGGYRGGEYNEIGGYYLVTQNQAHVWVEAYIRPAGWVRFDPTPSYPEGQGPEKTKGLLNRLKMIADAASYFWNSSVIPYDLSGQFALANRIRSGLTKADLIKLVASTEFAGTAASVAAVLLFFAIKRAHRRRKSEPYQRFISSFDAIMTKKGYIRNKWEGMEEFTCRIKEVELRNCASDFVAEFQKLYYMDVRPGPEQNKRLKNLLHALKRIS
ncbi:MAG: DUF3488 and transglutaminase-like domain-containing protein [Nitrospiraceae bacterium]|nr:DUF3488 and transglutaminase-like domain-containing protein [Nitrospiraceae bacterium]